MDEFCVATRDGPVLRVHFDPQREAPPQHETCAQITGVILSINPPMAIIDGRLVTTREDNHG